MSQESFQGYLGGVWDSWMVFGGPRRNMWGSRRIFRDPREVSGGGVVTGVYLEFLVGI